MTATTITPVTATQVRTTSGNEHWWESVCGEVGRRARRRVRDLGTEYVYLPGAEIVSEGSRAERFSLIIEGEVEVVVNGEVVNILTVGEFFGEVALLYTRPGGLGNAPVALPRTATVRTTGVTRVRELDRAELMTLMDVAPVAASRISRRAIGRLAVMRG